MVNQERGRLSVMQLCNFCPTVSTKLVQARIIIHVFASVLMDDDESGGLQFPTN
jgi:hypothetical protein